MNLYIKKNAPPQQQTAQFSIMNLHISIDLRIYVSIYLYLHITIYLFIDMNVYIYIYNAPPQPAEHFCSDLEIGVSEILSVPRQDFCHFEVCAGDFEIVGHFAESHR